MKNRYCTHLNALIFCVLWAFSSVAQEDIKPFMTSKYLVDIKNKKTNIIEHINQRQPFVLVFLAAECPISQKYAPILRGLKEQFPSVTFLAIFTKWDKEEIIKNYINEYPLDISVFKDKKNGLCKAIDARITPEAFLFDENGVLKYRGAIDNWFFALGKYRQEASEYYLSDAMNAILKNEPIKIKQTDAIGCIIEK